MSSTLKSKQMSEVVSIVPSPDHNTGSALELRGISYLYPANKGYPPRGIDQISIKLHSGQVYGLIGDNGAGKTTLFKLISGSLTPQTGQIYFFQREVTQSPQWQRVRYGLGYLTQGNSLVSHMSVEWNLKIGLEAQKKWQYPPHFSEHERVSPLNREEALLSALTAVGLIEHRKQAVFSLSGGERRRAELARLLVMRPRIILLDEPFAAIDREGLTMISRIIQLAKGWGALVLLSDHQTQYVNNICQTVLVLKDGKLQHQPYS